MHKKNPTYEGIAVAGNYLRQVRSQSPHKWGLFLCYAFQGVQYVKSHLRFNTNTIPMKQFNIRKKLLLNKIMRQLCNPSLIRMMHKAFNGWDI